MDEQNDEKWLDELICRTINTEKPHFDSEKWKQKYPDEYQALLLCAAKRDSVRQPSILKVILKSPLTKVAAAAVIIISISFFTARQDPTKKADTTTVSKITKSPVEVLTVASLTIAYRQGGMEAVEKQYEKASEMRGAKPTEISLQELLAEFNGK